MDITKIVHKIRLLHSVSVETPTSYLLAKLMINLIDIDWSDPELKILDPMCGRGTFLLAVLEKLEQVGHTREHAIKNMIYGADSKPVQVMIATKALKMACDVKSNIYLDNTLTKEWNMKFDVIIGNPPFQDGGRGDEANKLWPYFVKKAADLVEDNGYVAMISPNSWMQPTADIGKGNSKNSVSIFNDIFKENNLVVANVDSDAIRDTHFKGVGSTFSYYVFQKSKYSGNTEFITPTGKINVDIRHIDSLPKITSKESLSIMDKLSGDPFTWYDQNHGLNGKEGDTQGTIQVVKKTKKGEQTLTYNLQHKIYHTNKNGGTYWYGEKVSPYANKPKVIVSLSGKYLPVLDTQHGFSNMCMALVFDDLEHATRAQFILNSKLYQFWIEMQKFSGFNPRKQILTLPKLDLTNDWNDEKIYDHFKLSTDERTYINNFFAVESDDTE